MNPMCELPGHKGPPAPSVGTYQVYDDDMGGLPTMDRPAQMCRACVDFAIHCGLQPRAESEIIDLAGSETE